MKRVLIIGRADPRGSLHFLAKHLRAAQIADARVVALGEVGDRAWQDLAELRDGGQELQDLLDRADVLHLADLLPEEVDLFDNAIRRRTRGRKAARTILQVDGSEHAQVSALFERADREQWPIVCTDAASAGGRLFLPAYTPTWCALWSPQPRHTRERERSGQSLVFCGSAAPFRNFPPLERLVDRLDEAAIKNPRLRTEFLVTRSYRRWLQRQRAAQLVVTLHRPGQSLDILHALGQGVPVVADVPEDVRAAWDALADGTPAPVIGLGALEDTLQTLSFDAEPNERCSRWAASVLDPQRWLRLCASLYRGASAEEAADTIKAEAA